MLLIKLLTERKSAISERWFNLIVEAHPAEASGFLKEKDRFSDPVGYTIRQETKALYEELLQGTVNSERVSTSLDNIIRIRAVQDVSPHEAIAFVFLLKKVIREEMGNEIEKRQILGELLDFESSIDKMASTAFDIYVKCREKIYELRVNEVKAERDRAFRLLELIERWNGKHGEVLE